MPSGGVRLFSPVVPTSGFVGIVAVDGPSGAGKSTVSRLLATRLGARYLDTGAMYRAATWAILRGRVAVEDTPAVIAVVERLDLDISTDPEKPSVRVDDRPVDVDIRGGPVTAAVSAVSAVPAVRRRLVDMQRKLIGAGGIVVEGRDIGTVVAPEADLKVFLTASATARAGRRNSELDASGPADMAATAAGLNRRDAIDSTRAASPLRAAPDAVLIDTTELGIDEVVSRLVALAMKSAMR